MRNYYFRGQASSLYKLPAQSGSRGVIPQEQVIGAPSSDITAAALYGVGGTLDGLTLILNGITLTLNGATNTANEAALLAAIGVAFAGVTATAGGPSGVSLVLSKLAASGINGVLVGQGTANKALGLSQQRPARIGPAVGIVVTL